MKINKNLVMVGIVLIAVIIGAGIGYYIYPMLAPRPPEAVKEIIIGAVHPLGGPAARSGADIREGHTIALEQINIKGIESIGGAKIKIVYGDCKDKPDIGLSEAERLIAVYKPHMMMGSIASGITYTITEIAEKYQIPWLVDNAWSDSIFKRGFKWIFRGCYNMSSAMNAPGQFLKYNIEKGMKIKTVALVYEDTLFGVEASTVFRKQASELGLQILRDEPYTSGTADMSSTIMRLKASDPDIAFFVGYIADCHVMVGQCKELKFWPKVAFMAGSISFHHPDMIKAYGKDVLYFLEPYSWGVESRKPCKKPYNEDFVKRYFERNGALPSEVVASGYISMWIAKEVLEYSGKIHPENPLAPESIRDAFLKIEITDSPALITGAELKMKFGPNGDNLCKISGIGQTLLKDGTPVFRAVWPDTIKEAEAVIPSPPWDQR